MYLSSSSSATITSSTISGNSAVSFDCVAHGANVFSFLHQVLTWSRVCVALMPLPYAFMDRRRSGTPNNLQKSTSMLVLVRATAGIHPRYTAVDSPRIFRWTSPHAQLFVRRVHTHCHRWWDPRSALLVPSSLTTLQTLRCMMGSKTV